MQSDESGFKPINRGYNEVFRAGRLSLGVVVPIEAYPRGPAPTMARHLERARLVDSLGYAALCNLSLVSIAWRVAAPLEEVQAEVVAAIALSRRVGSAETGEQRHRRRLLLDGEVSASPLVPRPVVELHVLISHRRERQPRERASPP